MSGPTGRDVWRFVALSLLVLVALSIVADIDRVSAAFGRFDWRLLPAVLGLTLLSIATRYLKWEYLLRVSGIDVPLRDSFVVFWSALVMVVSPGKVGDAWKSWQLRERRNIAVSESLPVVVMERVADLLSILLLAIVGAQAISRSVEVVALLLLVLLTGVAVVRHEPTCLRLIELVGSLPYLGSHEVRLKRVYRSTLPMLRLPVLAAALSLSLVAYTFQTVSLLALVSGFGPPIRLSSAAFVFAVASVAGTFSFLPGGIGVTDGSMAVLLFSLGVGESTAVGTVILMRLTTTWFTVGTALPVWGYGYVRQ